MQSCFPAGALLRGEHRQSIWMADLAVGDQVYASAGCHAAPRRAVPLSVLMCSCLAGSLDRITNFTHIDHHEETPFLRLITEKGTLELSPNHLVFVSAADGSRKSALAETVRSGDLLLGSWKHLATLKLARKTFWPRTSLLIFEQTHDRCAAMPYCLTWNILTLWTLAAL